MSAGWPLTSGIAQVTSGTLSRAGRVLPPGSPVGEIGFLTPNNQRTATVECTEAALVLTITYERLLEPYFQNPQFGYYFLVLTSQRLLQNIAVRKEPSNRTKWRSPGWRETSNKTRSSSKRNRLARCLEQREHAEHPLGPHAFTRLDLQNDGALFAGNVVRSCGQATSGRGAAFAKQKRNAGKPQELCPGSQPCMPSVP
jgi:CRP-like cAMP-binding protein